jgi:hypothetical protein
VHMLELSERGGVSCGWILEIGALQPDLTRHAALYTTNDRFVAFLCTFDSP